MGALDSWLESDLRYFVKSSWRERRRNPETNFRGVACLSNYDDPRILLDGATAKLPNLLLLSLVSTRTKTTHYSWHSFCFIVSFMISYIEVAKGGSSRRGGEIVGTLVDGTPRLPTEWLVYCLDSLNANNGGGLQRRRE